METEQQFRRPTLSESALLRHLLEADFPGRDELAAMLRELEVRPLDSDGSLELHSRVPGRASVVKQVPVEGEAKDEDGVLIHVLLHVNDGRPTELEIFKEDGSSIKQLPPATAFELLVLPPAPSEPHR